MPALYPLLVLLSSSLFLILLLPVQFAPRCACVRIRELHTQRRNRTKVSTFIFPNPLVIIKDIAGPSCPLSPLSSFRSSQGSLFFVSQALRISCLHIWKLRSSFLSSLLGSEWAVTPSTPKDAGSLMLVGRRVCEGAPSKSFSTAMLVKS